MSDSIQRVRQELASLDHKTWMFDSPQGTVVAFDYTIETGSHKGKEVFVGLSFHFPEGEYPEYPPHWVHVSPRISDGKGGATQEYIDTQGREWIAMSRPPGTVWDRLLTKHMMTFKSEHLRRIWKDV